jgi:hypothetical protein
MALRQRGWAALASGAAAMMGLLSWASGTKAYLRAPALRDGQPGGSTANRRGCEGILLPQCFNEAGNHAHRPGTWGTSVQTPFHRLVLRLQLIALFGLVAFLAASGPARAAAGVTEQTLYTFCLEGGACPDGDYPSGALIMDAAGNLYGATPGGGNANNAGVVFELTPNQARTAWTESVLYAFCPAGGTCSDGAGPVGSLIMDSAGNLYGMTFVGGTPTSKNTTGSGVVFKLTPNSARTAWTESVLHAFCPGGGNCTDGEYPFSGLIMDSAGNLYGTAFGANASGIAGGVVFELTPNQTHSAWTENVLYSFCAQPGCADGQSPQTAGLIMDASGNLYGTTEYGGKGNSGNGGLAGGVVFKLTPNQAHTAWTETVLYAFCPGGGTCPDGVAPNAGLIIDAAGNLYGATLGGGNANNGGVVFELTPNPAHTAWSESVLYAFCPAGGICADGDGAYASLILDSSGELYGTTASGGNANDNNNSGNGVVFKLTPNQAHTAWTESVIYSFCSQAHCADGSAPNGLIFDAGGNLYGTTASDDNGVTNGSRTVFELSGAGTPLSKNPQTSDFNAGGKSDVLLQNTSGQAAIWLMNGATPTTKAAAPVGANPGPSWQAIGTGDFYGSLYSDILWQNAGTGEVYIWQINGTKVIGGGSPGNPGTSWHVIGTGDFNGDGKSDILLQNASGQAAIWLMNGAAPISPMTPVGANPGSSWHAIGSGDFYGSGYSDILWQNSTSGEVYIWEINGTKVIGGGSPGNPGPSWHVIGTGDFNGDGKADILLQNANGQAAIWLMNGAAPITPMTLVGANPGPSWHAIGTAPSRLRSRHLYGIYVTFVCQ